MSMLDWINKFVVGDAHASVKYDVIHWFSAFEKIAFCLTSKPKRTAKQTC